jgi:rod shape-determining protein MreB and related proteins
VSLRSLIGLFSGGPYYVRINRTRLSIRDISTGRTFESSATLGLDGTNRIVSVGDITGVAVKRIIEPFNHPRIVIADFAGASKLLQYGMQKMSRMKWINPSPILVIQPDMDLAGGLSEIENRALVELGQSSGARRTYVHYGSILSDVDVVAVAGA